MRYGIDSQLRQSVNYLPNKGFSSQWKTNVPYISTIISILRKKKSLFLFMWMCYSQVCTFFFNKYSKFSLKGSWFPLLNLPNKKRYIDVSSNRRICEKWRRVASSMSYQNNWCITDTFFWSTYIVFKAKNTNVLITIYSAD